MAGSSERSMAKACRSAGTGGGAGGADGGGKVTSGWLAAGGLSGAADGEFAGCRNRPGRRGLSALGFGTGLGAAGSPASSAAPGRGGRVHLAAGFRGDCASPAGGGG